MKTIKLIMTIIAMMAMPVNAEEVAEDVAHQNFFGGVEVGSISRSGYCDSNNLVVDCSNSNMGLILSGGYNLNDFFALEIKGMYVGDFSRTVRYEQYNGYSLNEATQENFNIGFGTLGRYPISEKLTLTGRVGFHHWRSWRTNIYTDVDSNDGVSNRYIHKWSTNGIDPYFGMGGSMAIDDKMTAHLGYTLYTQSDLDVIHGGLTINF